jgi:hypothetical protein
MYSATAQSHGHVIARWLDLAPDDQAVVACAELARIEQYAHGSGISQASIDQAKGAACQGATPAERMDAAWGASRRIGELLRAAEPAESVYKWVLLAMAALGGFSLALLWAGDGWKEQLRRWLPTVVVATALIAGAVWVTWGSERLPGPWPVRVKVGLTIAANTAIFAAVVCLRRFARWLDRGAPLAAALTLGLLIVSYTKYTQAEVYILVAVSTALLLVPWLRRLVGLDTTHLRQIVPGRALLAVILVALLSVLAAGENDYYPDWLDGSRHVRRAVAAAALGLFATERLLRRRAELAGGRPYAMAIGSALLAIAALWLRSAHLGTVAVVLWLVLPIAGIALWRTGQRLAAEQIWLASYVMVSRDRELVFLLSTVLVAEILGEVVAKLTKASATGSAETEDLAAPKPGPPRHAAVVGIVALLFSLTFVQRIGVQLGLDFPSFDWPAGTFGDAGVSLFRIGSAITYKHVFAQAALLLVFLLPLSRAYQAATVRGLLIVGFGRMVTLLAMLFVCRRSFWTALRVMGDVPHAFMAVAVATLACALLLGPSGKQAPRVGIDPSLNPSS